MLIQSEDSTSINLKNDAEKTMKSVRALLTLAKQKQLEES